MVFVRVSDEMWLNINDDVRKIVDGATKTTIYYKDGTSENMMLPESRQALLDWLESNDNASGLTPLPPDGCAGGGSWATVQRVAQPQVNPNVGQRGR